MLAALDRGTPTRAGRTPPPGDARLILDNAREAVAEALGVRRDEVSFTSSGTDAVHRGLLGLLRPGATVAHSAVEHSAVLHALAWRPDLRCPGARACPTRPDGTRAAGRLRRPRAPGRQPRGRDDPAAGAARAVFRDACASMGRIPLARGLVGRDRLGAQVGRPGRRRGPAGPQGRALAQPVPRRRPDRRAGDRVRERPGALGPRPRSRRSWPTATRSTPASTRWSTGSAPRSAAIPDSEVVGDPVARLPHLVTSRSSTSTERRSSTRSTAAVRGRQRLGVHRVDPRAEPRAGGHGRAHPRQRPRLAARDTPRPTSMAFWPRCPRSSRSERRGRWRGRDRAGLPGLACPRPVIELASGSPDGRGRRGAAVVADDPAARYDVPPGAGCASRSTSARTLADDGVRATWCGGSADGRPGAAAPRRPRLRRTSGPGGRGTARP